nr:MAG TPA: hypothetical protein [Caudoviricetes sp.]
MSQKFLTKSELTTRETQMMGCLPMVKTKKYLDKVG